MWVCPVCAVNVYADNCHLCGRTEHVEHVEPEPLEEACPLCGKLAQTGCLLGRDGNPLQWFDGPPTWKKNLSSAFLGGERVGTFSFGPGTYAKGIRCQSCRRIIIAY